MTEPIVKINQVSKKFQNTLAIDSLSASWNKGSMVGLVGPDGAGKTTLIRLLTGLMAPTDGTIEVFGHDTLKNSEKIHSIIGYMPQSFGLYEELSVIQNLTLYADLRGVNPSERTSLFSRLLHFARLEPFKERLARNLSGGMKQKLGLACALVGTPKLLILDEPTFGVDPVSRRELWSMVQDLLNEELSVLWSTSYLDEAQRCDVVLLLNKGKALFQGPPNELSSRVKGRVYQIHCEENKRETLSKLLNHKDVVDGVIQGENIRIVLKTPQQSLNGYSLISVEPRFEDAFMDILGGGPGGNSLLKEWGGGQEKNQILISAENLSKNFGDFKAVDSVSFSVKSGEVFGLLGPNGAGKSTTFRMLCGLLEPSSGTAKTGSQAKSSSSVARSFIGYMAQKFSLYNQITTMQNLHFFSRVYAQNGTNLSKRVQDVIKTFELTPYLNQQAVELPMGFKQRLALACAIMHEPKVLFLDEPTSGVDPITRREFWNHINCLAQKGVAILLSTHFIDEAEYCDRVGLIHQGKLIKVGTPEEVKAMGATYENPQPTLEDAFIALIEQMNQESVK